MSVRFDCELANLKEAGVTLADLTGDEVEDLVHAVDRVRNPFREVNLDAVGRPLYQRDGLTLYPLTIGAVVWLEEYAKRWWQKRPKAYFWAIVFCLIHGRERDVFSDMTDEVAAYDRIRKMGLTLCVCEDEIAEAVDVALDFNRPKVRKTERSPDEGTDWAAVITTLEARTGIEAEKWCWQKSADYAVRAYHELQNLAARIGGKKGVRLQDELDLAMNQLAAVRSAIVGRVKAERAAK